MPPLPYPYSMQQQQAMQGPPVPMYVPELVSLDALPPDQRFVTLTAPQATSVTALLAQQGIATQTVDLGRFSTYLLL